MRRGQQRLSLSMIDRRVGRQVLSAAAAIGLAPSDGGVFGTIEEGVVLEALDELAAQLPGGDDLVAEAKAKVRLGRSAGIERIEAGSVFAGGGKGRDVHLRYRSEMLAVFTDLAIDVELRGLPDNDEDAATAAA